MSASMTPMSPVHPAAVTDEPPPPPERDPASAPPDFRAAVRSMRRTRVRSEVRVEPIRPPQRLAPWSYAVAADVRGADGTEIATGRLVLLYDPDGEEAWDGVLRLVAFASAELEPDIAADPLLPGFGDLHGPHTTVAFELRGSWTARTPQLGPHLLAFADLLCTAAGLPPEGVTVLSGQHR